ncbi:hypothetical protein BT93_D1247 [Corymbia citriodora subsp. variegata]|nr:hypothetical protein BT93_D1247 [Corymbia citriodora subsp. variegata]
MGAGSATKGASTSADEETNRQSRGMEGGPSLNSLAIMRQATTPTDISSVDINDWHCVVYEGNCFLVLPKACEIAWGDEESCWSWITEKEKCFHSIVDIHVPESKKLSWLLIQGRFNTRALSPNTMYEVTFVVKLIRTDFRWPSPVKLELDLPDGTKQTCTERLTRKPREEWIKLHVGEFMMGSKNVGRIYFALHGTVDTEKSGLILRGVLIHPKDGAKHNQFDAVEHEFE